MAGVLALADVLPQGSHPIRCCGALSNIPYPVIFPGFVAGAWSCGGF